MFPNLHQLRSQQTRQRLLEAAVALLAQRGDVGLSLQEVARVAGVTTGAVQHHFASIAGLRTEVLSRLVQSLGEPEDFWPDASWPLQRRADHFVRGAWKQVFGHPRFGTSWGAFLAARAHQVTRAHIAQRLVPLITGMSDRLLLSFPELAGRADGRARAVLLLATLRGMGLAAPFCPPRFFDGHLALLSEDLVKACEPPAAAAARQRARPAPSKRRAAKSSR